jgi:hypothetical protein
MGKGFTTFYPILLVSLSPPLLVPLSLFPQDKPRIETSIFFKLLVASITAVGS